MKLKIKENTRKIQLEFNSSFEFIKDVLIFGGFILAFLLNFFYIAVEKDFLVKDAYLTIKHRHLMSEQELSVAISTIFDNSSTAKPNSIRLALCPDDLELIHFEQEAKGDLKTQVQQLLIKKFGVEKDWEKVFVRKFSRAKNPFLTPNIERFVLYYSWAIEILAIILLSQTIQKQHIQNYIFKCAHQKRFFFPIVGIALFIPFLQFIFLLMGRILDFKILFLLTFIVTLLITVFLYILASKTLDKEKEITELGIYIFISAIFIQLLAISGDVDMVYDTFSNPFMVYGRYASWFILITLPLLLIEKMLKTRKNNQNTVEEE